MKRKESKAKTFDVLNFVADNAGLPIFDAIEKAYNMGGSEQESILDKIRAEIENHCGLTKENHCRYCSYCNSLMGVREILEIIDKYREGSESE